MRKSSSAAVRASYAPTAVPPSEYRGSFALPAAGGGGGALGAACRSSDHLTVLAMSTSLVV